MSRWSPGVLAQSDAGSPYGYSYVRMRGLDQTRINFTLNVIPLNEMEDQGIYFSNMPDFLANMREVQVQRGIGTSKYGIVYLGEEPPVVPVHVRLPQPVGVSHGCIEESSLPGFFHALFINNHAVGTVPKKKPLLREVFFSLPTW